MDPISDEDLSADLKALGAELPDPLRLKAELGPFLEQPVARNWFFQGKSGAERLLRFIANSREPWLVRVAAILLFQFDPDLFYADFLRDAADYERATVEALEPGLWLGRTDEEKAAADLVEVAERSGNAALLLLLQRPAARAVRDDLRSIIARRETPAGRFAMYAYRYALKPEDREFLADIATWEGEPELASLAGLYLLELGFPEAERGIRRGLLAEDPALRERTYSALAGLVPAATFERAAYQRAEDAQARERAAQILLDGL